MAEITKSVPEKPSSWNDVECLAEISEIFYRNHSTDIEMAILTRHSLCRTDDWRDLIRVFLDTFITGYYGQMELQSVLTSLITYVKQFPSMQSIKHDLQWLKCTEHLKKQLSIISRDENAFQFIEYAVSHFEGAPIDLGKFPDQRSKMLHLLDLVLHDVEFYMLFHTYCKQHSLQKYIQDDPDMMGLAMVS